jgi:hypothetical protein
MAILKMNFNFNFKDIPLPRGASIQGVTNQPCSASHGKITH